TNVESYAIKCVVVIGRVPTGPDEKKSLELFRNNLNDVLVVTFDELLEKLRHLALHTSFSAGIRRTSGSGARVPAGPGRVTSPPAGVALPGCGVAMITRSRAISSSARSNNPSLKRPICSAAPESNSGIFISLSVLAW